jgi:cell division protein FtsA
MKTPRPLASAAGAPVAAIDVGTTKVACFIAKLDGDRPRIVGIGHQISRGVKNGAIVDIEAASHSIATSVNAAEQMAGEQISEAVVNLSGGFGASRLVKAEIAVNGRDIADRDMRRVLELGYRLKEPADRTVIHSVPVGFSIDGGRGIRDPRGMFGQKLAVNMNVVAAQTSSLRNLASCVGRCHLEIAALVVSPYAAGLAALVEDESELGVSVIDMGGGTTTIAVFFDGNLVFTDTVPVGGGHVTNDIARGLSTPIAHAERMKTLYGSAIASPADERETISVPQIGEDDDGQPIHVPKSLLVGIIAPRLEETFELVRDRLEASGFDKMVGRRIVLTGGACQLSGTRELAALILDKQIRIGRPLRIAGLAEATNGPAFATTAGLVHFAFSERAEIRRHGRALTEEPSGLFDRVGHWLREYF